MERIIICNTENHIHISSIIREKMNQYLDKFPYQQGSHASIVCPFIMLIRIIIRVAASFTEHTSLFLIIATSMTYFAFLSTTTPNQDKKH